MQKFLSTRISLVSRIAPKGKCCSAVDASGYIEREERDSEYDGHHYKPDAKEDLVHKEVNLPENAPEEYKDSSTCKYRQIRAYCTVIECMLSGISVHAFRCIVHVHGLVL